MTSYSINLLRLFVPYTQRELLVQMSSSRFHSQIFWKYCHTFSAVFAKEYDRSAYETFYEAIELFSQLASLFNLVLNLNFSKNLIKAFLAEMITFTFDLP